jgi:CRISPR/Cas system endoribonuclease Cas6 (RAMP superfamily)
VNRGLSTSVFSGHIPPFLTRAQRNHLACCYHAWLSLKVQAKRLGKTLYQVHTNLFRDYLRAELANPHVPAL